MSAGKQIEEYERPFNVVFGEYGADQRIVPGPEGNDFPIWRAPRFVMAIIDSQLEKVEEEEREALLKIRREFHEATTVELIGGMIRKFTNKVGKTRFIGITPKGVDYRDVGKMPITPRPTNLPKLPTSDPRLRMGDPVGGRKIPSAPRKPAPAPMSDAERIADKMAKSARQAVEGDQG